MSGRGWESGPGRRHAYRRLLRDRAEAVRLLLRESPSVSAPPPGGKHGPGDSTEGPVAPPSAEVF